MGISSFQVAILKAGYTQSFLILQLIQIYTIEFTSIKIAINIYFIKLGVE